VSTIVAICPLLKVIGVPQGGTPLKRLDSLLRGKKKSSLKLRHKIATGYEANGVWLSALHTCCVACLSGTEAASQASNRVSEACMQSVKK
jgi:hypothetical protein